MFQKSVHTKIHSEYQHKNPDNANLPIEEIKARLSNLGLKTKLSSKQKLLDRLEKHEMTIKTSSFDN